MAIEKLLGQGLIRDSSQGISISLGEQPRTLVVASSKLRDHLTTDGSAHA